MKDERAEDAAFILPPSSFILRPCTLTLPSPGVPGEGSINDGPRRTPPPMPKPTDRLSSRQRPMAAGAPRSTSVEQPRFSRLLGAAATLTLVLIYSGSAASVVLLRLITDGLYLLVWLLAAAGFGALVIEWRGPACPRRTVPVVAAALCRHRDRRRFGDREPRHTGPRACRTADPRHRVRPAGAGNPRRGIRGSSSPQPPERGT